MQNEPDDTIATSPSSGATRSQAVLLSLMLMLMLSVLAGRKSAGGGTGTRPSLFLQNPLYSPTVASGPVAADASETAEFADPVRAA